MPRRKNEIIFEAKIDYSDSRNMRPDVEERPDIEQRVRRALTEDLPTGILEGVALGLLLYRAVLKTYF